MSNSTNFVQLKLAAAATAAQPTLVVQVPSAPFQLPAANGTLTLFDVLGFPTKAEIVGYTTVTDNGNGTATLAGVTRGKEGTSAQAWAAGASAVQALTAGDYAADLAAVTADAKQWVISSADFTAAAYGRYLLVSSVTVFLPASPAVGSTVELCKVAGVTPLIQATGGKTITAKGESDATATYNIDARLLVVFNGTNWEI